MATKEIGPNSTVRVGVAISGALFCAGLLWQAATFKADVLGEIRGLKGTVDTIANRLEVSGKIVIDIDKRVTILERGCVESQHDIELLKSSDEQMLKRLADAIANGKVANTSHGGKANSDIW